MSDVDAEPERPTLKRVGLVSDHAGAELRKHLLTLFSNNQFPGWEAIDCRPNVTSEQSVDYPDYAWLLAEWLECEKHRPDMALDLGIAICGTGNGMAMTLNYIGAKEGLTAGLAWTPEIAKLIRAHNNATYLCLPARFITFDQAEEIVQAFLTTQFEGGRHQRRLDKIAHPQSV